MLPETFRRFRPVVFFAASLLVEMTASCASVPAEIPGVIYPRIARAARVTGLVIVELKISPDGDVVDAKAVSGPSLLRAASEQAARQWRFKASGDGSSMFRAMFDFRLEGSCRTTQSCEEKFLIQYPDRVIITSQIPDLQP